MVKLTLIFVLNVSTLESGLKDGSLNQLYYPKVLERLRFKNSILTLLLALTTQYLYAQIDQNAVFETQKVLRSHSERQEIISKDVNTQQADQFVSKIVGGDLELKNDLYGVSAEILDHVMSASGGDPAKRQELLLQVMKNPQQFLNSLPLTEQEKIRDITNSVDKRNHCSAYPVPMLIKIIRSHQQKEFPGLGF